jgi:hypothetical protein
MEVVSGDLSLSEGTTNQTISLPVDFATNGTYGGAGPLQVYFPHRLNPGLGRIFSVEK